MPALSRADGALLASTIHAARAEGPVRSLPSAKRPNVLAATDSACGRVRGRIGNLIDHLPMFGALTRGRGQYEGTGEPLVIRLRDSNADSNIAVGLVTITRQALTGFP